VIAIVGAVTIVLMPRGSPTAMRDAALGMLDEPLPDGESVLIPPPHVAPSTDIAT
jgi:hypothetical protein